MSSYFPEYVTQRDSMHCFVGSSRNSERQALLPTACLLYAPASSLPTNAEESMPVAPSMTSVPLPPSVLSAVTQSTDQDFYPLRILSDLPLSKKSRLQETALTSPIHVHTPHAHIGTIHTSFPGQRINSLDLILCLQSLAQRKLSFHQTYVHLPQQMKNEIQAAFYHRHRQLSLIHTAGIWEEFLSGGTTLNGPLGEDLFLGNTYVWGLEQQSIHEYSIVHLA